MKPEDLLSTFILIVLFIAAIYLLLNRVDDGSVVGFNIEGEVL